MGLKKLRARRWTSGGFVQGDNAKGFGRSGGNQKTQNDQNDEQGCDSFGRLKPVEDAAQAANVFRLVMVMVMRGRRFGLKEDTAGIGVKLVGAEEQRDTQAKGKQGRKRLPAREERETKSHHLSAQPH